MYKYFFGSFNKAHNHRDSDYLKKECDLDYYFDEKIYNEIADNIRMVLGNCKTYSVQDVFHYFQSQYAAYPIDIRYYYNYVNTSVIKCDAFSRFTISKEPIAIIIFSLITQLISSLPHNNQLSPFSSFLNVVTD